MNSTPLLLVASLLLAHATSAQETAPAAGLEQPPTLSAAALLTPELLRGPSHRVRDHVLTDGYLAHFEIDTDFGLLRAAGVPQVRLRVAEADAIRKLVETSKSDLFAEGMKRSLEQPIDAVKNLATRPVETVKRVPQTVGHFFSKVGSSIERGAGKVKQAVQNEEKPSAGEVGSSVGESAMRVAGFDKARLDTARQLGIDPYTDNRRLQEEIDKVTWAFFAGGLPLRIGAAAASAGIALTATNMVGLPDEIYALTQSELALRDAKSLATMGVEEVVVKEFQIQPVLSTTRRHRIVKALEALPRANGRARVVELANSCATAEMAEFFIEALELLARRQAGGAADFRELQVFGRLPAGVLADGSLEVPAPVDYVTWTEQVAAFAGRDDLGEAPRRLVHTGVLSPAAAAGFAAAGWQTLGVPYP